MRHRFIVNVNNHHKRVETVICSLFSNRIWHECEHYLVNLRHNACFSIIIGIRWKAAKIPRFISHLFTFFIAWKIKPLLTYFRWHQPLSQTIRSTWKIDVGIYRYVIKSTSWNTRVCRYFVGRLCKLWSVM